MRIRALTGFLDPGWPVDPTRFDRMAEILKKGRGRLEDIGYEVQTLRITTPPPMHMAAPIPPADRPEAARRLEAEGFLHGIDYVALGPALPEEPDGYLAITEVLAATENVFTSAVFASPTIGLSLKAAKACGRVIETASRIKNDGFANLRFAALANVKAGSPFFPAAYHEGSRPAFAAAVEGAPAAFEAFQGAPSLRVARKRLTELIERHTSAIDFVLKKLTTEMDYLGIDFSLAPFPTPQQSLGGAMELAGIQAVGLAGSIAVASMLTESIDAAQFKRTGFCGILTAVLEDQVLAERAASGELTIQDLLLMATVCGTGLDTIPLAGDVSEQAISALLIDLGALALRHDKPLTARLMPIPGKKPGDLVEYRFEYFASSKVMALDARPLQGLLAGDEVLTITPRKKKL
ncbi:MAG: DUF711 family protein [Anaerolineales bacterium]|nr:DUF711 family protein [Anaerolineales bacterium]